MSGQFTVLEKRAGYTNANSLRLYAQFREGTLYPVDADEYGRRPAGQGKTAIRSICPGAWTAS